MNVSELFNLGNQFYNEGRVETAMDVWNKLIGADPNFGPVHLQQHNVYRAQGNLIKAREALIRFTNCPVTMQTMGARDSIFAQIAELDKQLNPQLMQAPK